MPLTSTFNPNAPSATSGQGSAVANFEDLSSTLFLIEPKQTPITSMLSKEKASSTYPEWGLDNLSSPEADGVSEGADVDNYDDKFANVVRVGNYVQKFRRSYKVTEEQEAVSSAGPVDLANAEMKAMQEIRRDLEFAVASDNEMQAQTSGNVAYKMRGLGKWIQSSAQSVNPVPSDFRTPAASILGAAPTEITLNDVLASIFTETGEADGLTAVVGTTVRKRIAEFTRTDNNASETVYNVNQDAESKKVTLSVQLFESDFGFVRLVNGNPACMPSATTGYILNPKYLGLKSLIPFRNKRQENQGGGERGYISGNYTLCVKHPQAHGKISY